MISEETSVVVPGRNLPNYFGMFFATSPSRAPIVLGCGHPAVFNPALAARDLLSLDPANLQGGLPWWFLRYYVSSYQTDRKTNGGDEELETSAC